MTVSTLTAPEVTTTRGTVRGEHRRGITVFRGIPYAQPPVGALRFAAPRPVPAWAGTRDAVRFGPAVPQSAAARRASAVPAETVAPGGSASEDFLTLNIWTPDLTARRPVMVWIHGGAYRGGGTATPSFEGSRLALDGDVVVVTVNHRVGMEGFAQIEGAPANRGLLDVVAALRWVAENIDGFGGDPNAVTVFGQSAGAGAVACLLAMPAARGLFHRAIAQSVPGTMLTPALSAAITARVAADLGRAPTVAGLAVVDPVELAEAADRVAGRMTRHAATWGVVAHTATPFSPVVDGTVLPADPWTALRTGAAAQVPLIVGHTRDEFRAFTRGDGRLPTITGAQADEAVDRFGPPGSAARTRGADPVTTYETVNSDWLFRMPSAHLASVQAATGAPVHLFELAYTVPRAGGLLGAPHSADHPLVFGNFAGGIADRYYVRPVAAETERLGRRMRRAWADFARTGDPGWAPFTGEDLRTMVFDTEPAVRRYPHEDALRAYPPPSVLDLTGPAGT